MTFANACFRRNGQIDIIMSSAKVLTLSVPMFKIKLIDSFNFIPMRLADYPKTLRCLQKAISLTCSTGKNMKIMSDQYHTLHTTVQME